MDDRLRQLIQQSLLQQILSSKFHRISTSAADILVDVYLRYLTALGERLAQHKTSLSHTLQISDTRQLMRFMQEQKAASLLMIKQEEQTTQQEEHVHLHVHHDEEEEQKPMPLPQIAFNWFPEMPNRTALLVSQTQQAERALLPARTEIDVDVQPDTAKNEKLIELLQDEKPLLTLTALQKLSSSLMKVHNRSATQVSLYKNGTHSDFQLNKR